MSQDQIVANYATLISTDAEELSGAIFSYNRALTTGLFDLAELDSDHKAQVRALSKASLIRLRQRLESMVLAVNNATRAPDI